MTKWTSSQDFDRYLQSHLDYCQSNLGAYMSTIPAQINNIKNETQQTWIRSDKSDSFEVFKEVLKDLGVGYIRLTKFFSGICLCIANCMYFEDFGLDHNIGHEVPTRKVF